MRYSWEKAPVSLHGLSTKSEESNLLPAMKPYKKRCAMQWKRQLRCLIIIKWCPGKWNNERRTQFPPEGFTARGWHQIWNPQLHTWFHKHQQLHSLVIEFTHWLRWLFAGIKVLVAHRFPDRNCQANNIAHSRQVWHTFHIHQLSGIFHNYHQLLCSESLFCHGIEWKWPLPSGPLHYCQY